MYVDDFIWLAKFVEKIVYKHGVFPEEVEEVFFNHPRFYFSHKGHVQGEDLYMAMGQTDSDRYLSVFFILKSDNRALIISARDMDKTE